MPKILNKISNLVYIYTHVKDLLYTFFFNFSGKKHKAEFQLLIDQMKKRKKNASKEQIKEEKPEHKEERPEQKEATTDSGIQC